MSGDVLFFLFHLLVGVDAVGGDFDFANTTEGEQKLYEVLGRRFRSPLHDVADSVSDRGLEHDALGQQASQVEAHELARLQHDSKIVPPRAVKCKPSPLIRGAGSRQSVLDDASGVARLFLGFERTGPKTRHYKGKSTGRKTRHNGRGGALNQSSRSG